MGKLTLSDEAVRALFSEEGWPCERLGEGMWRSHFRGRKGRFPVLIRHDPAGYVTFAIVPFLKSPQDQGVAAVLYQRLMQLNHGLLMAKFCIDDDLDVVLSAEYPTAHLDRSEFRDALDVISFYADQHLAELQALVG